MSVFESDRNLLVGVLGLQMGLITESALLRALQSWVFRKSVALEEILLEQQAFNADSCRFLKGIAEQYLKLNGDDAAASLASLSSAGPIRKRLDELGDSDLNITLDRVDQLRRDAESTAGVPSPVSFATSERFRVLRPHAKGGLGLISIAEDRELNREVALKEIQPDHVRDASSRTRFMVEAEVTGRLEHPGIVPVYSMGTTSSGTPFYVMRFIRGDSLKEAIAAFHDTSRTATPEARRMALRMLVRRLVDVCNAIEYAHSRGVLHRDLKPGNIMLGRYGETLLVDWGLARTGVRPASEPSPEDPTYVSLSSDVSSETRMGSVVGTLAYMSPEQAEGRLDLLGPPADVYGLGATLYCLLTGRQPVPRQEPEEMLRMVREGLIPTPRSINPEIPRPLEAICRTAMARDISSRYASAARLAEDLELWLADEPVSVCREPLIDRMWRFARRQRTAVVSAVGVVVTAALVLGIANRIIREQNSQLETARAGLEQQRNKAIDNLSEARGLAVLLLDLAEERLSGSAFGPQEAMRLRNDSTEAAFKTFTVLHQSNPEDLTTLLEYARTARTSGNLRRSTGNFEAAIERYQLARDLMSKVAADAQSRSMRLFLSELHREIGTLWRAQGKLTEAQTELETAHRLATAEFNQDPNELKAIRVLATAELELSGCCMDLLQLEKSLALNESGLQHIEIAAKSDAPTGQDTIVRLLLMAKRILLLTELSRFEELPGVSASSMSIARELQQKSPGDINVILGYARILTWSAEGTVRAADATDAAIQESLADVQEVIKVLKSAIQTSGNSAGAIASLADALRVRGLIQARSNQLKEADASLTEAVGYAKALIQALDWSEFHELAAKILIQQSRNKTAAGDAAAAETLRDEAKKTIQRASELSPESLWVKRIAESM
ncbi:MAG: protein kinase domain-containing protein [Planctomycetota bacterium]